MEKPYPKPIPGAVDEQVIEPDVYKNAKLPPEKVITIKEHVVRVVYETADTNTTKTQLRVVSWNNGPFVLEKRTFYKKSDVWRMGKKRGLNRNDLDLIMERYEELTEIFGLQPKGVVGKQYKQAQGPFEIESTGEKEPD